MPNALLANAAWDICMYVYIYKKKKKNELDIKIHKKNNHNTLTNKLMVRLQHKRAANTWQTGGMNQEEETNNRDKKEFFKIKEMHTLMVKGPILYTFLEFYFRFWCP